MKQHNYYVYITTNPKRTTLYIGVTNDLAVRLHQHQRNAGNPTSFAGKYHCYNLIYYEWFQNIEHAIAREKQLKRWGRKKKEVLINRLNPEWRFLNSDILNEK